MSSAVWRRPLLSMLVAAVVAAVVAGVVADARAPGQDPRPQPVARFRADINHVEIDAVVVDGRGEFVSGLTTSDFEIFEDGRLQTLSTVRAVDLPTTARATPDVASGNAVEHLDALTNENARSARLYVLVLDDLHTDARRSPRVRSLARRFITTYLQPGDVAAILTTGSHTDADRDFTSDRQRLLEAVDRFEGSKVPSLALTLLRLGCFHL